VRFFLIFLLGDSLGKCIQTHYDSYTSAIPFLQQSKNINR